MHWRIKGRLIYLAEKEVGLCSITRDSVLNDDELKAKQRME